MRLPVIVLGAGGHAKVLINALLESSAVITGIVDSNTALAGTKVLGVPVLGGDNIVNEIPASQFQLVNGLGSVGLPIIRQQLYDRFKNAKGTQLSWFTYLISKSKLNNLTTFLKRIYKQWESRWRLSCRQPD